MSYYQELLDERWLNNMDTSLESLNSDVIETISAEGFSLKQLVESAKNLVKRIIDFFVNIYKQASERISRYFKGNRVEKIVEEIEILTETEIINEIPDDEFSKEVGEFIAGEVLKVDDPTDKTKVDQVLDEMENERKEYVEKAREIVEQAKKHKSTIIDDLAKEGEGPDINISRDVSRLFEKYPSFHIYAIFNAAGTLFDIDQVIEMIKQDIGLADYYFRDTDQEIHLHSAHRVFDNILKFHDVNWNAIRIYNISKKEVYKNVSKLPEMVRKAVKVMNEYRRSHGQMLTDLEKEANDYAKEYMTYEMQQDEKTAGRKRCRVLLDKLHVARSIIISSMMPYRLVMTYIQLLRHLNKEIFGNKDYITTSKLPASTLYHISLNPIASVGGDKGDTGVLEPKLPRGGGGQFLPERISFAPDPLDCCPGCPHIFERHYNRDSKRLLSKQVYLYKAIPDQETRCIKPKIMKHSVGEYNQSKEIALTTPTKVECLGEIKITFREDFDSFNRAKYLKYEFV